MITLVSTSCLNFFHLRRPFGILGTLVLFALVSHWALGLLGLLVLLELLVARALGVLGLFVLLAARALGALLLLDIFIYFALRLLNAKRVFLGRLGSKSATTREVARIKIVTLMMMVIAFISIMPND